MNSFTKLIKLLIVCLLLAISSCAQVKPNTQQNQYDERVGIISLISTIRPLYSEFEARKSELKGMIEKRKASASDISKLQTLQDSPQNNTKEGISKITNEYEILDCKIKNKQEEISLQFEKRKKELTKDLTNKIAENLKQFAKEKGYIIVLDNSQELVFEDSIDITMEFIRFYNSSPRKKPE